MDTGYWLNHLRIPQTLQARHIIESERADHAKARANNRVFPHDQLLPADQCLVDLQPIPSYLKGPAQRCIRFCGFKGHIRHLGLYYAFDTPW